MSILSADRAITLQCRTGSPSRAVVRLRVGMTRATFDSVGDRFDADLAALCAGLSFSADSIGLLSADLRAAGFDLLSVSDPSPADPNRTGIAIASLRGQSATLIVAVLSGTRGAQWYSNFRLGFTAEHRGFAIAADDAEGRLYRYLHSHAAGGNLRFLLTGYSRGGAVANILARRLCDRYGTDRVSCYTFASPNTVLAGRRAAYDTIHNLVRREDFFTRLPLEDWGYTRYGSTVNLTGDIRTAYRELTGDDCIGYPDSNTVDDAVRVIRALAPNVPAYYRRRRPVGDDSLSLYEYMLAVAATLADDEDGDAADILLNSAFSEYADLTAFLCAGADPAELLTSAQGLPRCSASDSHSPAAYLAAMRASGLAG